MRGFESILLIKCEVNYKSKTKTGKPRISTYCDHCYKLYSSFMNRFFWDKAFFPEVEDIVDRCDTICENLNALELSWIRNQKTILKLEQLLCYCDSNVQNLISLEVRRFEARNSDCWLSFGSSPSYRSKPKNKTLKSHSLDGSNEDAISMSKDQKKYVFVLKKEKLNKKEPHMISKVLSYNDFKKRKI